MEHPNSLEVFLRETGLASSLSLREPLNWSNSADRVLNAIDAECKAYLAKLLMAGAWEKLYFEARTEMTWRAVCRQDTGF